LRKKGLYEQMWSRQREATAAEDKLRKAKENDDLGILR